MCIRDSSITRSRLNAVKAHSRIVEKNLDLLASQPILLAYHYHKIGGGWRDLGQFEEARCYLLKALKLSPFASRSMASLVYTFWLGLRHRLANLP